MATTNFYNINSIDLINKYDNANMSSLHQLLIKHIPKKSNVLDVGFGSGRDLQFLFDNGYDIWGIDPSIEFVNNIKERFSTKKDHFFKAAIPFGTNIIDIDTKFNAVISIAMWMHLERSQYVQAVQSIASMTLSYSSIIISYSSGSRAEDERCFQEVDSDYLTKLFNNQGFKLIETVKNGDSLNRNSLTWVTVVYKNT